MSVERMLTTSGSALRLSTAYTVMDVKLKVSMTPVAK
jgi:hypothetical protein